MQTQSPLIEYLTFNLFISRAVAKVTFDIVCSIDNPTSPTQILIIILRAKLVPKPNFQRQITPTTSRGFTNEPEVTGATVRWRFVLFNDSKINYVACLLHVRTVITMLEIIHGRVGVSYEKFRSFYNKHN